VNHIHGVWGAADTWQRLAIVLLTVATLTQTIFILTYGSRPWWRSRVGRALMLKSSTLSVLLWLSLVNTFFIYPGEEPVAFAALLAVTLAIIYQLVVLLRTPRHPD
jgi:hypothetical protein